VDIGELKDYLEGLIKELQPKNQRLINARLESLKSVFPFTEYEYVIMFLFSKGIIKFRQYEELREKYVSSNPYLELFGISPREFGEIWAHAHIIDIDKRFKKPTKALDALYDGEYDLWFEGIKVEVKASRATNTKKRGSLIDKALRFDSIEPFWMNYQQIKPDMADVFIFVGVWVEKILYWVMSQKEIKENKFLSPQHRGGVEFQIGITKKNIHLFNEFLVEPTQLSNRVLVKGEK
jgi:hypothetical protein